MNNVQIRKTSLLAAQKLGYSINPNLPLMEKSHEVKVVERVASRMFVLHCLGACAYGFDRKKATTWLEDNGAIEELEENEKQFFYSGVGNTVLHRCQIESLWALAWAISLIKELDFSKPCADDIVTKLPELKLNESGENFRAQANLRDVDKIVSFTDLSYCLHWAIVDAKLHGRSFKGKIEPYIIIERRRALEWLISDVSWNEVSMDT